MRARAVMSVLLLCIAFCPASAQLLGENRLALVIGNATYKSSPLTNPVNDARLMEQSLKEAGFTVIKAENASRRDMQRLIRDFGDKLKQSGGVGLFYFAGHGVQVRGNNYLIPVDADIKSEDEVAYDSIDAQAILEKMESAKNRMNLIVLDACRDNPFAKNSRSASAGLATMSAPSGSLVAYSTAPGSVASDGSGKNGLYTEQFARALQQPGLPVEEVFKQVRAAVRRASNNQQTPWENTALEGQFYFKAPVITAAPTPPIPVGVAKPSGPDPLQIEMALWDSVKTSNVPAEIQAYVSRHPNGVFSDLAKARIAALQTAASERIALERAAADRTTSSRAAADKASADAAAAERSSQQAQAARQAQEMAFWDNIKVSNRPSELEAYIAQFPNGLFVGLAKVRLADSKVVALAVANAQAAQAAAQTAAPVVSPVQQEPLATRPPATGNVAAATPVPVQAALPNTSTGVLGQVVVTDQLTNNKQTIDVVVLEKTDKLISYSTGDKVTGDGKVLAARMGTFVAELKSGNLWQFPLQPGSSGSAVAEFAGLPGVPISLGWKVKNVSGQRAVVEVDINYRPMASGAVSRYGSWRAEFADGFAIPMQYKFAVRGSAGNVGPDLFAGDFTKIGSK